MRASLKIAIVEVVVVEVDKMWAVGLHTDRLYPHYVDKTFQPIFAKIIVSSYLCQEKV